MHNKLTQDFADGYSLAISDITDCLGYIIEMQKEGKCNWESTLDEILGLKSFTNDDRNINMTVDSIQIHIEQFKRFFTNLMNRSSEVKTIAS